MPYLAQELRQLVTIQYIANEIQNAAGELEQDWQTFATVYALIDVRRSLIVIRWITGVDEHMRVKFGGRYFKINSQSNLREENRWIELSVTEELE